MNKGGIPKYLRCEAIRCFKVTIEIITNLHEAVVSSTCDGSLFIKYDLVRSFSPMPLRPSQVVKGQVGVPSSSFEFVD